MNRSDFLGRISERLGRPVPTAAPTRHVIGVPEFWTEPHFSPRARLTRFCNCLKDLGAEVHVVDDLDAFRRSLNDVLKDLGPKHIGIWNDAELQDWVGHLLDGCDVATWGIDAPERFAVTDVGITGCTFAVADTGTLVLSCRDGRGRSVHLLPSVHVAVVKASQLRERLGEALSEMSQSAKSSSLDSYVHFVTGPSRSSDIENDQSIGVHGPAAEVVFVVENL